MILDATILTRWQGCERRGLLDHDWEVARWRPKTLLDVCLRKGIMAISRGTDPHEAAKDARTEYLTLAANPGLDVPENPYTIAKDHCALLTVLLLSLARLTLLRMHHAADVRLTSTVDWRMSCMADDSGALHRWVTVDRWDHDEMVREGHSWHVVGDIAMARVPMTLHAIEIGQRRHGRQATPWTRAWRHPGLGNTRLRWRKKDGSELKGWEPVYLADNTAIDVDEWIDGLDRERVPEALVKHIEVVVPSDAACGEVAAQALQEAVRLRQRLEDRGTVGYRSLPMSRAACDAPGRTCPFQDACYGDSVVDLASLGLYVSRSKTEPILAQGAR